MFSIHLLRSNNVEEVVKKIPSNVAAIVISEEYICVPRFVEYAFMQAFKTFEKGQNTAKTISLESICNLALKKNVSNAVNFTRPSGTEMCFAAMNCFETPVELANIGIELPIGKEFRQKAEEILIEKYDIFAKALAVYKFEDLLIEKAAVENI